MKNKSYIKNLDNNYQMFDIKMVASEHHVDFDTLPYTIRVLVENVVRNSKPEKLEENLNNILHWDENHDKAVDFLPSRIILQDLTGVPAIVDLAALRSAAKAMGKDPEKINPELPVDMVIDHSIQVDESSNAGAFAYNRKKEFERNHERYEVLKWAQNSFKNLKVVAPDLGIIHQVNLEFLAPVVSQKKIAANTMLFPDSVFGTDSHTTMINGLGILGWGVGGIEAEAAMLGTSSSFPIPEVVGVHLHGEVRPGIVAMDVALTVTHILRENNVVGKFVEYFGDGYQKLSVADRATLGNMSPEYGATCGFFPFDQHSDSYLKLTNRTPEHISVVDKYFHSAGLYYDAAKQDKVHYTKVIDVDLSKVTTSVAGPKRPQDLISLEDVPNEMVKSVTAPAGNQGFGFSKEDIEDNDDVTLSTGEKVNVKSGDILLTAITSCTNTSNPTVMIGAGLLAKAAVERGMKVSPKIKHSFAPGSPAVKSYLEASGLLKYLEALGFDIVGFGCTTCIGNSGKLDPALEDLLDKDKKLISVAVESANRNFESRVHPKIKSNYLASPLLVVAYTLAGSVRVNLQTDPIGRDKDGNDVYLKDLWPSTEEIDKYTKKYLNTDVYKNSYKNIFNRNELWNKLPAGKSTTFNWNNKSTYISNPPYFDDQIKGKINLPNFKKMRVLAKLGDSVTTDHISPGGAISLGSAAAKYLESKGIEPKDFNTYGSRRGNDHIMVRGTFGNVSLHNELADGKLGSFTNYLPENKIMSIFNASQKYKNDGTELIVLGGKDYGMGSSRDWAAKGTKLLGVDIVIAESYERIHRSNLVMMGVVPLQYQDGQNAKTLGLTGREVFDINFPDNDELMPGQDIKVRATDDKGNVTEFTTTLRFDSEDDISDYLYGGILNKVLDQKVNNK